jgi:hypothetical protein
MPYSLEKIFQVVLRQASGGGLPVMANKNQLVNKKVKLKTRKLKQGQGFLIDLMCIFQADWLSLVCSSELLLVLLPVLVQKRKFMHKNWA